MSDVTEVRAAYGVHAGRYIELFGSTAQVHSDDVDLIGRHLSIRPGRVLDVGCGPGHLTEYLRIAGVQASGLDLVPEFVRHARSTHPLGRYELGTMDALPAEDSSIAGILAWYSLIHLSPDDLDGVLHEFRRVLVPTGRLVIGFFPGDEVAAFEHKVVTAWFWPIDELSARLRAARFIEVERQERPARGDQRPHAALAAVVN